MIDRETNKKKKASYGNHTALSIYPIKCPNATGRRCRCLQGEHPAACRTLRFPDCIPRSRRIGERGRGGAFPAAGHPVPLLRRTGLRVQIARFRRPDEASDNGVRRHRGAEHPDILQGVRGADVRHRTPAGRGAEGARRREHAKPAGARRRPHVVPQHADHRRDIRVEP